MAVTTRHITEENMQNSVSFYVLNYYQLMLGMRDKLTFSVAKENIPALCAAVLEEIFINVHHWNERIVETLLSAEIVDSLHLRQLVDRIPSPPEIDRETDYRFVSWYIWPRLRDVSEAELIRSLYDRIIRGEVKRYPKKYFQDGVEGRLRARILFQSMLDKYLSGKFKTLRDAYAFFAKKSTATKFLKDHGLGGPAKLFATPLEYFHAALSQSQRSEELYQLFSEDTKEEVPETEHIPPTTEITVCENYSDIEDLYDYAYDDLDAQGTEMFMTRANLGGVKYEQ